jgi:hypothetical protein
MQDIILAASVCREYVGISEILVRTLLYSTDLGIEVFISEVYNGPLKSVLVFLPTLLLPTGLPLRSKNR